MSDTGITVTHADGTTVTLDESYVKNHGNGTNTTYTVEPNQYFVMGDNRPESSDSRYWGTVPRANIVGHVFVRLFPLSTIGINPGSTSEPQ